MGSKAEMVRHAHVAQRGQPEDIEVEVDSDDALACYTARGDAPYVFAGMEYGTRPVRERGAPT